MTNERSKNVQTRNSQPPVCNPSLPSILSVPNTKVSNIFGTLLEKGERVLAVGSGTLTRVSVYYMPLIDEVDEAGETVRFRSPAGKSKSYTEFDRAVLGAVSSLVQAGNSLILPSTIARLITGCINAHDISEELLRRICESLEKQMFIFVELDYTEELKRKHPDADITVAQVRGWLLPHTEYKVRAGGYIVHGYEVTGCPILFEYANAIDQVLPIPLEYLAVGGSNTAERVALKHYMLRRILAKTTKMQDRILFKNLYEIAGITESTSATRTPRTRVNKFVHTCLSAWLEMGILTDFDYERDKRGTYIAIKFSTPYRQQNKGIEQPPELSEQPPELLEPPEPPVDIHENQIDEVKNIIAAFGTRQDT